MEHLPTDSEFEIMKDIDFIVPLKQVTNNVILTTTNIITNINNIGWCNNKSST